MVWHHCCGWSGHESDLKPFVYEGIVAGMECPGCGGEWPFFNDDDDMFYNPKHVGEPDKCDTCGGAGEIRIDWFRDGEKARVKPCKTCGGRGFARDAE